MSGVEQVLTILIAGAATVSTRVAPFVAFPANRPVPAIIRYLGRVLPGAIFALLILYSLRHVDLLSGSHGIPEAVGVLVAAGLYIARRNMLVAIFGSTLVYLLLVNLVLVA
ncbi:AzlD domain-containing protein [Collinsella sp. AGMB00827]|uniref:AzlD domain-containing protein n=1 Tax=Collinsella ureilytica TaxID=2869515 RepID=A0ABS7MIF8_9ACTN|nr:AzlD domain-containing protein [Collinsella urealyticum]MBY4797098.1 AzlD domain-containing protein [Collinsella urealyticum]